VLLDGERLVCRVRDDYEVLLALDAPAPDGLIPSSVHLEGYVPLNRALALGSATVGAARC